MLNKYKKKDKDGIIFETKFKSYDLLKIADKVITDYSSLSIENNPLSLKQVEDVINGKIVMAEQKDIQEVKNAIELYNNIRNIYDFFAYAFGGIRGDSYGR